jgi:hypothetical protein
MPKEIDTTLIPAPAFAGTLRTGQCRNPRFLKQIVPGSAESGPAETPHSPIGKLLKCLPLRRSQHFDCPIDLVFCRHHFLWSRLRVLIMLTIGTFHCDENLLYHQVVVRKLLAVLGYADAES